MKLPIAIALAAIVAAPAFAGDRTPVQVGELGYPAAAPTTSAKTRAEVRAELAHAQAAGLLPTSAIDYPPAALTAAQRTGQPQHSRAEVVQELHAARAAGDDGTVTF